jgi:hypothetical protein
VDFTGISFILFKFIFLKLKFYICRPIEGIHPIIKPIADWSPITFSVKSFLNVYIKKHGIMNSCVYIGLLYNLVWILVTLVLIQILLSKRKFAREV